MKFYILYQKKMSYEEIIPEQRAYWLYVKDNDTQKLNQIKKKYKKKMNYNKNIRLNFDNTKK